MIKKKRINLCWLNQQYGESKETITRYSKTFIGDMRRLLSTNSQSVHDKESGYPHQIMYRHFSCFNLTLFKKN